MYEIMIKNENIVRKILLFSFIAFLLMSVSTIHGADINLAVYNGIGSIPNCVNNVESIINTYNNNHPDINIHVSKISGIKSLEDLNGINVLLFPGGTHGYTYFDHVNGDIIRSWVNSGHGYVGICAGAYAGVHQVDDNYISYNVAPHVNAKAVYHEGLVTMNMTLDGANILGVSPGKYDMVHANGPVMYANSEGSTTIATYDTILGVGYNNWSGIIFDTYGSGKTILFGPHPESQPGYPDMLGNAIKYVSN
jgi:glutamine amidotransferase-like uncharacterized protein